MPSSFYCKSIIFSIFVLLLASCASRKSTVAYRHKTVQNDVVDYGKKYLNKPYRYAGKGPSSFDCSGYTSFVFKKFGYKLNASSAGQAQQGVTIRRKEKLEVGDLVFFEGRSRNGRVGHVGIVSDVGRSGRFSFIHASTSNGVIISSSEEPYYRSRYLRGGRILEDIPKSVENQESSNQNNYAKVQEDIIFKESDDGFIATLTSSDIPMKDVSTVSKEQPLQSKTGNKEEDKNQNNNSEIRQLAITATEESILPASNLIKHIVKPGETLFSISLKHNCSVDQLKEWNPKIINNVIRAGDVLDIHQ